MEFIDFISKILFYFNRLAKHVYIKLVTKFIIFFQHVTLTENVKLI